MDPPFGSLRPKRKDANWHEHLVRKFGIHEELYDMMLASQRGGCAICGKGPTTKRLAVDHCHDTGEIRGLLCDRCNRGLGSFRDDPELLARASRYLKLSTKHADH